MWNRSASLAAVAGLAVAATAIAGAATVSLTDNLESAAGAPGPVHQRTTSPLWSDARISGRTNWTGTTATNRTAFFTDDPVAGNASMKVALEALAPFPLTSFYFGARADFFTHNAPARRAQFVAAPGISLRAEATIYSGSINTLWTFEPSSLSQNSILDRVTIGGPCVLNGGWGGDTFECSEVGVEPGDPMPVFMALAHYACSICPPEFMPLTFLDEAPQGLSVGDYAPTPFGGWFRLIFERDDAGTIRTFVDYLDGQGEFLIRETPALLNAGTRLEALGVNGSFSVAQSPCYIDDLVISGALPICDGDANGDGLVDFTDLNITLGQYSTTGAGLGGDFNGDQQVNFADLNILLGRFNAACD